jgi:hypothetical protein
MVIEITGRELRSQPAARPCCRLSDFRPPQLSYLPPPLTPAIGRLKIARFSEHLAYCGRNVPFDFGSEAHQDPRVRVGPFCR